MADRKNTPPASTDPNKPQTTNTNPSEAQMKGDVAEKVAEEQAQGFLGKKVDPRPDSDYSLESGPDSPSAVEDDRSRIEHHHA